MLVQLNIVKTYPVRWSEYKVFRDFIQNFYDSVGYRNWKEKFQYSFDNGTLKMWIEGVSFSYEWLMHIGASTKTNNSLDNAGYFGEGFKIASLCAVRDYNFDIEMSSSDWKLTVEFVKYKIDEKVVEMMAYNIQENNNEGDLSLLKITGVSIFSFHIFQVAMDSFFYHENPIMGKVVWESSIGAVLERSKEPINPDLPYIRDYGRKGAVFCGYQMLGTNPFNMVVALHSFKKEDRERSTLYKFDVVDVFKKIASHISAHGAVFMLEKMRRHWNTRDKRRYDIYSWSTVIDILTEKVAESEEEKEYFKNKYPLILCLKKVYTNEDRNRRHEARRWLKSLPLRFLLVKDSFLKFGYKTLEKFCEEHGGFAQESEIESLIHKKCFDLLDELVRKIYGDFFIFYEIPKFKVIENKSAIYHGQVTLVKNKSKDRNNQGILVRYRIKYIYIKKDALVQDNFFDALSTFLHETCHMFGSDSSEAFSHALTFAITILLENMGQVQDYHARWKAIFSA